MCANRTDDSCCQRIVEYSNSKEGGMNDVQVVEVKRLKTHGSTCQNFRRDPKSRRKIVIKSSKTDTSNTLPCASRGLESPSQPYGKDPSSSFTKKNS